MHTEEEMGMDADRFRRDQKDGCDVEEAMVNQLRISLLRYYCLL